MSLTNRVIIPVVGNRQNPDEQNVFVHSTFTLTPQKPPQKPEPILWKKSMSAFKKFKEKRDRKDKRGDSSIEHPSENLQEVPKSFVKLVKRTEACLSTKILSSQQDEMVLLWEENLGYFDPNEAPLYKADWEDEPGVVGARQKKAVLKQQTTVSCKAQAIIQSMQSEGMQENGGPQLLPDDPFIIVRKHSSKRGLKSSKTKFIKKQKTDKVRFRDFNESESICRDKCRPTTNDNSRIKLEESPQESSDQKFGGPGVRQIFTLQQILQSASTDKIKDENKKSPNPKDMALELDLKLSQPDEMDD